MKQEIDLSCSPFMICKQSPLRIETIFYIRLTNILWERLYFGVKMRINGFNTAILPLFTLFLPYYTYKIRILYGENRWNNEY